MSKTMQTAEDQITDQGDQPPNSGVQDRTRGSHSGTYERVAPVASHARDNNSHVQIPVDRVDPDDVEVFSTRATLVDPNEAAAVDSGRRVISAKAHKLLTSFKDDRLDSEDVDEALKALDDHVAYRVRMDKEVEHHILEKRREQAHFELTRRSRGFFTKLRDFASNVWSGATPEEAAKGRPGAQGIRGLFLSQKQRQTEMLKPAGIDAAELKKNPDPKPEPKVAAKPDAEFPLPIKSSLLGDIGSGVSKVFASIRGGISNFFKNKTVRRLAVAGAVAGGVLVAGSSSCGKGCGHTDHIGGPVASNSGTGGDGGGGAAPKSYAPITDVPTAAPTATAVATNEPAPAPVAPAPTVTPVDKNESKQPSVLPAPQKAKVSTVPKPSILQQKKAEPKLEPVKVAELKNCDPDAKMQEADLDKCLVASEDADKFRKSLYEQLEEQKKALAKIYEPIQQGPEFVANKDVSDPEIYKRDRMSIDFLEGQSGPGGAKNSDLRLKQNEANKKEAEAALATARKMVEDAKTPKDFYAAVDYIKKIGEGIDLLTAGRAKQIAAIYDAVNLLNSKHVYDKITEIEKDTGKKVHPVGNDKADEATVTKSTIDLPMTKQLLEGSEREMFAPALSNDPDKVITDVKKKLEYYRGLLQVNTDLDRLRVKNRAMASKGAAPGKQKVGSPGPRLTASAL